MFIKELNLLAFGKFKNKSINLDKGMNIVYGENEAGKTTIHKFIEGMFFGFFKPYTKVKRYRDEYEKYIPWDDSEYKGILKFYMDGNIYRLERNFLKGYDEVKMFDDTTGDDLTCFLEYNPVIKLPLPGPFLLGINNSTVYNNTASIKQLGSKTDEDLAREVKDSLTNIGGSLDEDVSIKNALNFLDYKKNEIGTKKRKKSSPYGKIVANLQMLNKEREEVLEKHKQVLELGKKLKLIKKELEHLEEGKNDISERIKQIEVAEKIDKYYSALKVGKEIEKLKEEKEELERYSILSFKDYEKLLLLDKEKENIDEYIFKIEKSLEDISKEIEELQGKLNDLNKFKNTKEYEIERLFDDMKEKIEYKGKLKEMKKSQKWATIFLVLIFVSLVLGFVNGLFFFLMIPFIIGFVYTLHSKNRLNKKEEELEKQIIDIEKIEKEYRNFINLNERIKYIQEKETKYNEDLKENCIEKNTVLYNIQSLLSKNKSGTLEEFKKGLENKKRLEEIEMNLKLLNLDFDKILGNNKLEELEDDVAKNDLYVNSVDSYENKRDLETKLKEIVQKINNKKIYSAKVEESIVRLSNEFRPLVEIDENIIRLDKEKEYYENKLISIDLAKETIENISKNIHKEFAPILNKNVSEVISMITDGKYENVKINEDIDIKVAEPAREEMKNIDCLSGGTVDQFYFATRFVIIDTITEKKVPLILDDCFVQYDKNRLTNILNLLGKESECRQIILFTCNEREKDILDKLGLEYNFIKL